MVGIENRPERLELPGMDLSATWGSSTFAEVN